MGEPAGAIRRVAACRGPAVASCPIEGSARPQGHLCGLRSSLYGAAHLTFIRVRMRWRSARPSCWKHALMRDGGRALPCGTCRALLPGKDFEKIGALKRTLRLLQVVRQRAAPDRGRAPLPYEVCALWGHPHLPFIRVCRWWRSARPQGRSGAARRLCEPCSGRGGSVGDFTRRCAGYERNGGQNAHPTLARFACLLRYRISNLWRQLRH